MQKQVAGVITSSTITTVAVFLPIVFIEGMIADIFMSMALSLALINVCIHCILARNVTGLIRSKVISLLLILNRHSNFAIKTPNQHFCASMVEKDCLVIETVCIQFRLV